MNKFEIYRSSFEGMPVVTDYISSGEAFWCRDQLTYRSLDQELDNWIGGAWFVFCQKEMAHHAERTYNEMAESQLAQANIRFQELNQDLKQKISKFEGLLKDLELREYGDLDDGSSLQALVFEMKRILQ